MPRVVETVRQNSRGNRKNGKGREKKGSGNKESNMGPCRLPECVGEKEEKGGAKRGDPSLMNSQKGTVEKKRIANRK